MTRFVARLLSVVIPLLVWVSAGVSPVAAVGTTPILLVVNDTRHPTTYGDYLARSCVPRAEQLHHRAAVDRQRDHPQRRAAGGAG